MNGLVFKGIGLLKGKEYEKNERILQNVLNLFKGKKNFKGKKEKRVTILKVLNFRIKKMEIISSKRRRRRRISITAGEESEANVTCGFTAR